MLITIPIKPIVKPKIGDKVFIADYTDAKGYRLETWSGNSYQVAYLKENLIFSTKKEAVTITDEAFSYFLVNRIYTNHIRYEPKDGDTVYVPQLGEANGFQMYTYRKRDRHLKHAWRKGFLFKYDTQAKHYCNQVLEYIKKPLEKAIADTKESERYKYLTQWPARGTKVYIPAPRIKEGYCCFEFDEDDSADVTLFLRGLCFRTARDAKRLSSAVKSRAKHVK